MGFPHFLGPRHPGQSHDARMADIDNAIKTLDLGMKFNALAEAQDAVTMTEKTVTTLADYGIRTEWCVLKLQSPGGLAKTWYAYFDTFRKPEAVPSWMEIKSAELKVTDRGDMWSCKGMINIVGMLGLETEAEIDAIIELPKSTRGCIKG